MTAAILIVGDDPALLETRADLLKPGRFQPLLPNMLWRRSGQSFTT